MARLKRRPRRRRARRNEPNPRRRRRAVSAFRGFRRNPSPRRRRRRGHRRNPVARRGFRLAAGLPTVQQTAMDVLWAGGGFIGTKFVGNMVMPMIGVTQPMARIAVKGGLAYGTAWGLSMVLGDRRVFLPLFLGGMAEVIQDIVRTYISPMIPALAAAEYPLEVYPEMGQLPEYAESMGAYPEVLGQDVEVAQ